MAAKTLCRQYLSQPQALHQTSAILLPTRSAGAVALNQARHTNEDDFNAAKPLSEMPKRFLMPKIGTLYRLPFLMASKKPLVERTIDDFKKFGPIYFDKVGPMEYVFTNDADAVETIHRVEGKYPQRLMIESWAKWREEKGMEKGILIE